jgi:hypothetical protein
VHAYARSAKGIPLVELRKCAVCKKKIKLTDWVYESQDLEALRHVACPPPGRAQKVHKGEAKPLLLIAERGA